jgi:hypothetical protein
MLPVNASENGTSIATSRLAERFWWALLIAIVVACILWGFVQPFPFNIILWVVALVFLLIFLFLVYRSARGLPKLKLAEVRRLIHCEQCGVETEGPFESGDHVFREIGKCPRCGGKLVIKAIYTIDTKEPLKRQQPKTHIAEKEVTGEGQG